MAAFIAMETGFSTRDITTIVLSAIRDTMVPVPPRSARSTASRSGISSPPNRLDEIAAYAWQWCRDPGPAQELERLMHQVRVVAAMIDRDQSPSQPAMPCG